VRRRPARRAGAPALWLAAVLTTGCLGGASPPDHFYRLSAGAPAEPLARAALPGTVEVERFSAEGVVAERPLLFTRRSAPLEVHQQLYHYWTESPTVLLQRQLVDYLRAAGAGDTVVTPALGVRPDWVVQGRIERFEVMVGGERRTAVVEIELGLTRSPGGALVHVGTYRAERPVADDGAQAAVEALGHGVAEIYGRFLADVARARAAARLTPPAASVAAAPDPARSLRRRSRS
jgi:cholesterol transport system auxiliary component